MRRARPRHRLRLGLLLGLLLLGAGARSARAQDLKDRFNVRLSLSGMYLRETQDEPDKQRSVAGPLSIGYGDLRMVLDARRLPGNFELHLDGRVRLTGNYSTDQGDAGATQTGARGYLGGREYQVTELWARGRWSKIDFGLGRLLITEADALRVDGVRLWVHVHKKWDLSLYGGGYANPYSRSLDTDYVGGSPAFVGGANVRYGYDRIWGSFSANAVYLGGNDDGGPLVFNTANTPPTLEAANPQTEPLRAYVTWTNFWRPIKYLDFYHDLVVDVAGAAGVQLTRLNAFVAAHVNKHLTLRLGYDHMSAIAIEMYLTRLLQSRTDFVPGSIENKLTLSRTARDEGRLTVETQFGRTTLTAEGRLRRRVLVTPSNDPQFVYPAANANPLNTGPAGSQVAPTLGYDATLAVRNRGSLWDLRPSLWLTYLRDYRARDLFVGVGLGRDFLKESFFVDVSFTYANVHDEGADNTVGCTATALPDALKTCFGTRIGHDYQAELSLGGTPFKHWFMFADYRAGVAVSNDLPAVITHVILGRLEARY